MNVGRNQIEVIFSIREAQSLLMLLTEVNRDGNKYKGSLSTGVVSDNANLQRELERLLLTNVNSYSSIQTRGA